MNTSGVAAPPEIWVMRLARLVSVFVGAERSVTWIFGYFFSKALISTVRGSGAEVVIGLAHQTMFPLVAEPFAFGAPLLPELPEPPELPHAASVSTQAAASAVNTAAPRLLLVRSTGIM
jgi:hypothetical protein